MGIFISSIFGGCVGIEFLPKDMISEGYEEALWGLLFDLLFFRVMLIKF